MCTPTQWSKLVCSCLYCLATIQLLECWWNYVCWWSCCEDFFFFFLDFLSSLSWKSGVAVVAVIFWCHQKLIFNLLLCCYLQNNKIYSAWFPDRETGPKCWTLNWTDIQKRETDRNTTQEHSWKRRGKLQTNRYCIFLIFVLLILTEVLLLDNTRSKCISESTVWMSVLAVDFESFK